MGIEEYRKNFLVIKDYEHVDRYFRRNPRVCEKEYKFVLYKRLSKKLEEDKKNPPPKVNMIKKRYY